MANTYTTLAAGKLPALSGNAKKIPTPGGLKVKICKLLMGSVYPDAGILASTLETAWGFTHIEVVVPCGGIKLTTGVFPTSWDGVARKLQVFANPAYDGNAQTVGTFRALEEIATNSTAADIGVGYFLVFGY